MKTHIFERLRSYIECTDDCDEITSKAAYKLHTNDVYSRANGGHCSVPH